MPSPRQCGARGPYHDFFCVDRAAYDWSEYGRFYGDPSAVRISDDLLRYLADTLSWIPAHNPSRGERHKGLCWYGPTVIAKEGASSAQRIFEAWATLFRAGPPRLALTGGYGWTLGDAEESGRYERLSFVRDDVVDSLSLIAAYAARVAASDGSLYVLHLGI